MTEAPTKTPVFMEDGSTVEFGAKQRLLKTSTVDNDSGAVSVRLDFSNGKTLSFSMSPDMILQFAAHGAEQKLGDAIAGVAEIDDAVEAVAELITRLNAGEWTVRREKGSGAGASILLRALVEVSGKDVETIRAFLATKSQAEKMALRRSDKLSTVIARLEAEKVSKTPAKDAVDTDALFGELDSVGESESTPSRKRVKETVEG